jgi:hypothetical protein
LVNVLAKPICLKRPNEHVMKPAILGLALTLNLPATGLALADKVQLRIPVATQLRNTGLRSDGLGPLEICGEIRIALVRAHYVGDPATTDAYFCLSERKLR